MFSDAYSKGLLLLAKANYQQSVKEILANKSNIINPNLQDEYGMTALHWAVQNLSTYMVHLILNAHTFKNNITKPDINIQDNKGCTVLHYLAKTINNLKFTSVEGPFYYSDNYSILEILFKGGINVNIKDYRGNTALHYAVSKENLFFIEELLTNNANPFILNNAGFSVLDNLNNGTYSLKGVVIGSIYCKYPNSKDIIFRDKSKIISDDSTLLGDNHTFESIDDNA